MAKNKKRADGRYSCQVYLGKGPDGKRKYKTFYGSTLREAKAAADDFRSAVSKGMDPEQAEATLGTLYDNLIAAKKAKGIGQKSIDRLATNKAHWGELVDVPASELRAADFQQVLNNLADWHDGKPPLSHFTLTNLRGSAKAAYDLAIPEIVMYNPLVKTITPAGLRRSRATPSPKSSSAGSVRPPTPPSELPCSCSTPASAAARPPPSLGPTSTSTTPSSRSTKATTSAPRKSRSPRPLPASASSASPKSLSIIFAPSRMAASMCSTTTKASR